MSSTTKTLKENRVRNYLIENPDYIEYLEYIIEYEENNKDEDAFWIEDKDYDSMWSYKDVQVSPQILYQMESNGIIDRVRDTNSTTEYSLINREKIKQIISEIDVDDGSSSMVHMHDFPENEEDLDGLFDDVVGYDRVKWLFKRAITTDKITNVLLVGPTGSAKTVFLMCIERLDNSEFISGSPTSGPGVLDVMFDEKPKYMLIDEFDDMEGGVQQVLSQYTETGIVDETKVGKTRKLETNTKTFASANTYDGIIDQIRDRFLDIHFDPYEKDEFIEICEHILPRNEDVDEDEARVIAEGVWDISQEGDVRKAIQIARLSRGDPEKVIEVVDDYSVDDVTKLGL